MKNKSLLFHTSMLPDILTVERADKRIFGRAPEAPGGAVGDPLSMVVDPVQTCQKTGSKFLTNLTDIKPPFFCSMIYI